jgi:anthranilate phosphoribosyltransferase
LDGYDEVSLTSDFKMISNQTEQIVSPESLGMKTVQPEELHNGSTVPEAAKLFVSILEGNGTKTQNNVVIANSALALKLYYQKKELNECIEMAKDSLLGKKALGAMKKLLE